MFIIDETSFMKLIKTRTMCCMITFQIIGLLIAFYGHFGFDHASSYGLDFSDFMRLVYLIGLAFCIGAGLAIATKDYFWATIQGPPALVFVLFFIWVVFH